MLLLRFARSFSTECLKERVQKHLVTAMKNKESARVNVLRHVLSEFVKAEKSPSNINTSSVDYYSVLRKCERQWEDAIGEYRKVLDASALSTEQRDRTLSAIKKESDELSVIQSYIPPNYSQEDLTVYLENALKRLEANGDDSLSMGKLIKEVCEGLEPHRVDKKLLVSLINARKQPKVNQ